MAVQTDSLRQNAGDASALKKQIEELGLRYGLATSQTAFAACADNESFSGNAMVTVHHGSRASEEAAHSHTRLAVHSPRGRGGGGGGIGLSGRKSQAERGKSTGEFDSAELEMLF